MKLLKLDQLDNFDIYINYRLEKPRKPLQDFFNYMQMHWSDTEHAFLW